MGVVEADLDADSGRLTGSRLCDAPLPQGAVCVCLTGLETDVPHTGVTRVTVHRTAVARPTTHRGPHTAVLGVRGPVPRDPGEAGRAAAGWLVVDRVTLGVGATAAPDVAGVVAAVGSDGGHRRGAGRHGGQEGGDGGDLLVLVII